MQKQSTTSLEELQAVQRGWILGDKGENKYIGEKKKRRSRGIGKSQITKVVPCWNPKSSNMADFTNIELCPQENT